MSVIYTHQNLTIERIPFNNEFWDKMQPQLIFSLNTFYLKHVYITRVINRYMYYN